ncbi:MAG: 3-dehydroquinate synthase [Cyanobacteriota bacterium]|nr:3-dehydroquinate synthase [Cyanobacteriota bacterium]
MFDAVIPVKLPTHPYQIVIQGGILGQLGSQMATLGLGGKILLVSNPAIAKLYGETVLSGLTAAGFQVQICCIPAGERYKTLKSVSQIYDAALAAGLERSSVIVALGGGVIGDMAGFAAATWLRGIPFVQVPTSLLAMVDASIGGKTGVNHPQGKNLIGAFHQPSLVWMDPLVLKTLPTRELRSALAEVIKYGVIQAPDIVEFLEGIPDLSHYRHYSPPDLHHLLVRSAECKAWVVQQDEKEGGLRAILNYGHTLGHALESVTHYRRYRHGEAVGLGMIAAGQIGVNLGWWGDTEQQRQTQLLAKAGLPTRWPSDVSLADLLRAMQADKKIKQGKVQFILPRKLGQVEITQQVTEADVSQALAALV